jgi:predicted GIY-YIG superfamily endonuclease
MRKNMRRRRTSPLILRKSFEDKTEAIRKEYESMANVFALAKEENDKLILSNNELRENN